MRWYQSSLVWFGIGMLLLVVFLPWGPGDWIIVSISILTVYATAGIITCRRGGRCR